MSEKEQNTTPQQGDVVEQRSGALTGSGAVDFIIQVSENPTVATAVGGAVVAKVLSSSPKDLPPPEEPKHHGLWVPPSADD